MQLDPFVSQVQRDLAASVPEDSAAAEHAERLAAALDSSLRLALISALSSAADELSADLVPGSVSLQLRAGEPRLVAEGLTPGEQESPQEPEQPLPASSLPTVNLGEEGDMARFNLRLPENLKAQAEDLAAQAGQSLNSWLIRAVGLSVSAFTTPTPPAPPAPPVPPRGATRQRVTGWMN